MFLSYALGVIILILVLLRQLRVRPVPRTFRTTLPIVLGVVGLFEMIAYAGDHHVTGSTWAWVLGALAIGAVGVGALRGLSMRVWTSNQWDPRAGRDDRDVIDVEVVEDDDHGPPELPSTR